LTGKVGQTDLVLVCNQGLFVGLRKQDYKSLCPAVTICATLIDSHTHTDTHTDSILTNLYEQLSQRLKK